MRALAQESGLTFETYRRMSIAAGDAGVSEALAVWPRLGAHLDRARHQPL
jgi:hypothetical protein